MREHARHLHPDPLPPGGGGQGDGEHTIVRCRLSVAGGRPKEVRRHGEGDQKRRRPPSAFLRRRIDFGVISSTSSSRIHSSACSRFMVRGGVRRTASSEVEERTLVSFFSLVILTSRSLSRACSPTTCPS